MRKGNNTAGTKNWLRCKYALQKLLLFQHLQAPDKNDNTWPEAIRVGSGAKTMALLNDVPIWFELWRKLNGFPPNYYQSNRNANTSKKK